MKHFFQMTRKERIITVIIAVMIVLMAVIAAFAVMGFRPGRQEDAPSDNSGAGEYLLYLDYGTDFRYTYAMEFERSTSDDGRITFRIPAGETAVFTIVPVEGKILKDVSVKAGTDRVKFERQDNDISFKMPAGSVSVTPVMAVDTSYATPTPGPKTVAVEGVTPELAALMKGQYKEELFLDNLRIALSLDNKNSSYSDVTVISFTGEAVDTGIADTVGMVAVLNHTTTRKVLVSYNTASDVYSFTLNYVPTVPPVSAPVATKTPDVSKAPEGAASPTPTKVPTKAPGTQSGGPGSGQGNGGTGGGSTVPEVPAAGGTVDAPVSVEEFISNFTLYEYPESFSSYVGGSDAFFNALFDYVYEMDPTITSGTFEGFSVNGNTVRFTVVLSNGGTLAGTYDRSTDTFYF